MTEGANPWGAGGRPPWWLDADQHRPAPGPRYLAEGEQRPLFEVYRPETRPVEDLVQASLFEQLEELDAPSAKAAWNLAGVAGRRAVPIDPTEFTPTGEALPVGDAALPAVLAWWFERPRDGVGVVLGSRQLGVLATPATRWPEFVNEHVRFTARREMSDPGQDERLVESPDVRPVGCPCLIAWAPPPAGGDAVTAAAWRIWSTASTVRLARRRQVETGLVVLGPGEVVPWHVWRRDGWLLQSITSGGIDHPDWWAPAWLVDLFVHGKRPVDEATRRRWRDRLGAGQQGGKADIW